MLKLEYKDYTLDFKFDAETSRGILRSHRIMLLKVYDPKAPAIYGLGEAAPLPRLSTDRFEDVEMEIPKVSSRLKNMDLPSRNEEIPKLVGEVVSADLPSLRFALELAMNDLFHGGRRLIFENDFFRGAHRIQINGLIWMGDPDFMKEQIDEKIAQGFTCVKLKVGALDFDEELNLIKYLRSKSPDLTIRVDANGGFANHEALSRLGAMKPFGLHSIEQPIMPKQPEAMQLICRKSTIPIALDEELIGVVGLKEKRELLSYIKPQYLVLKPTLLGGFEATMEWIRLAEDLKIGWWITSALESSIGLNGISQFVASLRPEGHQGLGTGQLYVNNFYSPLQVTGEYLAYDNNKLWEVGLL